MKIVTDWKDALHHYSTLALAFVTSLGLGWHALPQWVANQLPLWAGQGVAWAMTGVAGIGLVGKFIDQPLRYKPPAQLPPSQPPPPPEIVNL